jgi:regulation of enolase protein 1 (concanavalin A-like superfamily)
MAAAEGERRGAPYWVRLVRQGDTVTAYRSADGRRWTETGSETVELAETAYVGLAAAPLPNMPGSSIAFDNITVIAAR